MTACLLFGRGDKIRTCDLTPPQTHTLTGLSYTPRVFCFSELNRGGIDETLIKFLP